jgi:hypothetical protein
MGRRNGDDGGKTTHLGTSALALVAPLVLFVLLACHSTVYIHHRRLLHNGAHCICTVYRDFWIAFARWVSSTEI